MGWTNLVDKVWEWGTKTSTKWKKEALICQQHLTRDGFDLLIFEYNLQPHFLQFIHEINQCFSYNLRGSNISADVVKRQQNLKKSPTFSEIT